MQAIYGETPVAQLAEVLAGPGREPFSLCVGEPEEMIRAMVGAPEIAWSLGRTAKEDSWQVADWLADGGNGNVETTAAGAVVALPKSYSLAAAGDEELRKALMVAWAEIANDYMEAFRSSAVVRIYDSSKPPGERESLEHAKAIRAWGVGHTISGGGDPHLHLHLLIGMRAQGESGRFGQIYQPQMLKEAGRLAHGAAMHRIQEIVQARGYALDERGEIAGIGENAELIEASSRAQTSIHALQAALGAEGIHLDHDAAWEQWRQLRAGHHVKGLSPEVEREIKQLIGDGRSAEHLEHVLDESMSDGAKRRHLVEHWGQEYGTDLTQLATDARKAASKAPQLTDVDRLVCMVADSNRAPNIATVRGYAAAVVGLAGCDDLMQRASADMRVLAGDRTWATVSRAEQEAAIIRRTQALVPHREMTAEAALGRTDISLAVVSGVAGSGKSHRLMAAGDIWRHEGRHVYATARNALTAHDTADALGCKSWSVAGLRMREEREAILRPGDVLVVDEAGLLDAPDIDYFLGLAESGVVVKMLGDERQLSSIDGSTAARLLIETSRKHGQPYLDTSVRCETWQEAHDSLRATVTEPTREHIEQTVSALNIVPITQVEEALTVGDGEYITATNAVRSQLAEHIPRPPEPADERQIIRVRDDQAAWSGDRVIVRQNIWHHGKELADNGQTGQIDRVTGDTVTVHLDRTQELITLDRREALASLALGGAWTADSAQGQTFDMATVVVTGQEAGEWLYSAATRSRAAPTIAVVVGEVQLPARMEQALKGTPEHALALAQARQDRAAEIVRGTLARSQTDYSCVELAASDATFAAQAAEKVPDILTLADELRSADEREVEDDLYRNRIKESEVPVTKPMTLAEVQAGRAAQQPEKVEPVEQPARMETAVKPREPKNLAQEAALRAVDATQPVPKPIQPVQKAAEPVQAPAPKPHPKPIQPVQKATEPVQAPAPKPMTAAQIAAVKHEDRLAAREERENKAQVKFERDLAAYKSRLVGNVAEEKTKLHEWEVKLDAAYVALDQNHADAEAAQAKISALVPQLNQLRDEYGHMGRFTSSAKKEAKQTEISQVSSDLKAAEALKAQLGHDEFPLRQQTELRQWRMPVYEVEWARHLVDDAQKRLNNFPAYEDNARGKFAEHLADVRAKENKRWVVEDKREAQLQAAPTDEARDELRAGWEAERQAELDRQAAKQRVLEEEMQQLAGRDSSPQMDEGYGFSL